MAEAVRPFLLLDLHQLVVDEYQWVLLDVSLGEDGLGLDAAEAVGVFQLVFLVEPLRLTSKLFVDDEVLLLLLDEALPANIPKLLHELVLQETAVGVSDVPRQVAKAVLVGFCFIFESILKLKSGFLVDDADKFCVVDVGFLVAVSAGLQNYGLLNLVYFDLVHQEEFLETFAGVLGLRIGREHEGKSECFESVLVFILLELVIESVNLVFLFYQGVVVQLQHLFLPLLVYHDHLVDVTLGLSADALFVDKGEDAHGCHLGTEVVNWFNASSVEFPELGEVL